MGRVVLLVKESKTVACQQISTQKNVNKLNRIHARLGDKTAHLLWLICYAGYSIKDIKLMYNYKQTYAGERIRESLQELADLLSKKF